MFSDVYYIYTLRHYYIAIRIIIPHLLLLFKHPRFDDNIQVWLTA